MWLIDRKYNHEIQIYNFIVRTKKKLRNKGRRFQAQTATQERFRLESHVTGCWRKKEATKVKLFICVKIFACSKYIYLTKEEGLHEMGGRIRSGMMNYG